MTAFVIGNGLSRKGIDLSKLDGTTYGCNLLYTEFIPDVLVAVDDEISKHIQNSKYAKTNKFYTRKVYGGSNALSLNLHYKRWASGPNAVQLAVINKHKKIVVIGFDFGSTSTYNNIYANSEFYNNKIVYAGDTESQLSTIIRLAKYTEFEIVQGIETSTNINNFLQYDNVLITSKDDFIKNYIKKV